MIDTVKKRYPEQPDSAASKISYEAFSDALRYAIFEPLGNLASAVDLLRVTSPEESVEAGVAREWVEIASEIPRDYFDAQERCSKERDNAGESCKCLLDSIPQMLAALPSAKEVESLDVDKEYEDLQGIAARNLIMLRCIRMELHSQNYAWFLNHMTT